MKWKDVFPWIQSPEPTTLSQSTPLPQVQSHIFILNSEFLSVQSIAIQATDVELYCYVDYSAFTHNGNASLDLRLRDKGSVVITRSLITDSSSLTRNTLYLVLGASHEGFTQFSLCSFSRNELRPSSTYNYNMIVSNGMSLINNINNSFCNPKRFGALNFDCSPNSLIRFCNFAENTAETTGLLYTENGLISSCNFVSNVEKSPDVEYWGIIITNSESGKIDVDRCYIANNTGLSHIRKGTIRYYRCSISGDDVSTKGSVFLNGTLRFERIEIVCFASKDVQAIVPHVGMQRLTQLFKTKLAVIQSLSLLTVGFF